MAKPGLIEIERKYLVSGEFRHLALKSYPIIQGYLFHSSSKSLRVRIAGNKAFITLKAKTGESLITRFEWEKEIGVDEALEMIKLCGEAVVEKERFEVPFRGQVFEVDVFSGKNKGLIVAEIELTAHDSPVFKPDWLGEEVSEDPKYINSELAIRPYSSW